MKKSLMTVFFATIFLGLAGCANEHVIATDDGHIIDSADKPEVNDETGMIEYEDAEGRENQVPVDDVSEIKER